MELGEEESGQSSIVTMYERHDYGVSDTDHDDDDPGEMFANKLVIDLDNSITLNSLNSNTNTMTIAVKTNNTEISLNDMEHHDEVGVRFVSFMDILGKDEREDINEDKTVIKVEAKEMALDFKTTNSHKTESETQVKNRDAIKEETRYSGIDENNNETSRKPLEEHEPNDRQVDKTKKSYFSTRFLSCFGCICKRK